VRFSRADNFLVQQQPFLSMFAIRLDKTDAVWYSEVLASKQYQLLEDLSVIDQN
jgi:hypothetical protein